MLGVPAGRVPVVVACSGGVDSAAALLLVRTARPRAQLIACYVDHGMRSPAATAGDRRAVRAQAATAGARVVCSRIPRARSADAARRGASPEAALRSARYALLTACASDAGAAHVVAGHQRDDVAESALLALIRGSGVDGIAAMRPRRRLAPGIALLRPFLWASKDELAAYAASRGVPVAEDETNVHPRYRRNLVRAALAVLERAVPGTSKAIARSAAIAAEDAALLRSMAASSLDRAAEPGLGSLRAAALRPLPAPLVRHVLRLFVQRRCGSTRDFSYAQCVAVANAVRQGRGGSFPAGSSTIVLSGGRISVERPRDRVAQRAESAVVRVPSRSARLRWSSGEVVLRWRRTPARDERIAVRDTGVVRLDGLRLPRGSRLTIRTPVTGDRFRPSGRSSAVSLARFLAKQRLSPHARAVVPLLCVDGDIAAVLGVRASADFAARPGAAVLEARWVAPNAPRLPDTADV